MLGIIMNYTIIDAPDGIDISCNGSIYHFATMPEDIEATLQVLEMAQAELFIEQPAGIENLSADTFKSDVSEVVDKYTDILTPTEVESTFTEIREEMLVPPLNSEVV